MKKDMKTKVLLVAVFLICMVIAMIWTMNNTCGNNIVKYHLRKSPDVAMEEYLEKRYDDDVTCLKWGKVSTAESYWQADVFEGQFESKNYPGVKFECSAWVTEDRRDYTFEDNYMVLIYYPDFRDMIKEMASKYFEGEYYVGVEAKWYYSIKDTVEFMPFEDFAKMYLQYGVTIVTEEMSDAEVIERMQEFVDDAQAQGLQCDFSLGRLNTSEKTFEEFYTELWEMGDDFFIEKYNTRCLYSYTLPSEEGESEPEVYIWTGEKQ